MYKCGYSPRQLMMMEKIKTEAISSVDYKEYGYAKVDNVINFFRKEKDFTEIYSIKVSAYGTFYFTKDSFQSAYNKITELCMNRKKITHIECSNYLRILNKFEQRMKLNK